VVPNAPAVTVASVAMTPMPIGSVTAGARSMARTRMMRWRSVVNADKTVIRAIPILRGVTQLIPVRAIGVGVEFRPAPRKWLRYPVAALLAAAFALACALDWERPTTPLCDPVTALPWLQCR
jgi:hypothetical protein